MQEVIDETVPARSKQQVFAEGAVTQAAKKDIVSAAFHRHSSVSGEKLGNSEQFSRRFRAQIE